MCYPCSSLVRNLAGGFQLLLLSSVFAAASAAEFKNFLGMTFVDIPAGSFVMGAAKEQPGVPFDELPPHRVTVKPFQMMVTEVTLEQYKKFILQSGRVEIVTEAFMDANNQKETAPVVYVSWNDVRKFAYWLNQNRPVADKGRYRLPTEAEWEYACRAGKMQEYCGSNKASKVAWYVSKTIAGQMPVATRQPNAFGLYDMSGNVREWVEDCYHSSYERAPVDGHAWSADCGSASRVIRGGSWEDDKRSVRATVRMAVPIPTRVDTIGFRLVRELPR